MPVFTDVMVDIETTGTSRDHSAIIQLCAVRFNLDTRDVDADNIFNACLSVPNNRFWDESTRQWWSKMPDVLRSICARMRDPRTVMEEFYWWSKGADYRLWSKPSSFDQPLIDSYFREYGPASPYAYWKGRDLRSFIQGVTYPYEFDEKAIPFQGTQHDAVFDVLHQIKLLFAAMDQRCSKDLTLLS